MTALQRKVIGLCLAGALWGAMARPAAAIDLNEVDVAGRNYTTLVIFAGLFNPDCFQFDDDDGFVGSLGLLVGTWSIESETVALIFSVNYVQVELISATEATLRGITFMDNQFIVGDIQTDDGDTGFYFGFETDNCRWPGRGTPDLKPIPEPNLPRSRQR